MLTFSRTNTQQKEKQEKQTDRKMERQTDRKKEKTGSY